MEDKELQEIKLELREITKDISAIKVSSARTETEMKAVQDAVEHIKTGFVSNETFYPIKLFVYSTMAIISTAFLMAILALIQWSK